MHCALCIKHCALFNHHLLAVVDVDAGCARLLLITAAHQVIPHGAGFVGAHLVDARGILLLEEVEVVDVDVALRVALIPLELEHIAHVKCGPLLFKNQV